MNMDRRNPIESEQRPNQPITAVVANHKGEIFELKGYAAVGMAGSSLIPLTPDETINMPYGGELMLLPNRKPVVYNIKKKKIEILDENPYAPGDTVFPVAAFNSPGYVLTYVSAYTELEDASHLPLFSYGAVGWHRGKFRTTVIQVDKEKRQDLRLMKREKVIAGIQKMRKKMPKNRLRAHLEKCALVYNCPAGKNFFLGRYEAPLPTSRYCNARCIGCISLQPGTLIPHSQERITFTPSPEEIAEIAIEHINNVKSAIVSFGQGCEGDPLLAAEVIEPAIMMIRSETRHGTININTNGSKPNILKILFDAGLDSVRISINSFRKECYNAYFRPVDYSLEDVTKSADMAENKGKFLSINYLNSPGFTDTPEEMEALVSFIKHHPIHMIQWRNLNFDPLRYWKTMYEAAKYGRPLGMKKALNTLRRFFPHLKYGYFNPPKEKF
jgi:pyruvate-formate lyase-activating enzyme